MEDCATLAMCLWRSRENVPEALRRTRTFACQERRAFRVSTEANKTRFQSTRWAGATGARRRDGAWHDRLFVEGGRLDLWA